MGYVKALAIEKLHSCAKPQTSCRLLTLGMCAQKGKGVSINVGTPTEIPIYYNPYYGTLTKKKVSLCRSLRCWTHEHEITLNPNDTRRSIQGYSWSKQYPSARSKMRDSSSQINTYSQTRASNHRFTRSNVDAPRILIFAKEQANPKL